MAPCSAAPHVAETLPTVRRGPGDGEQSRSAGVPPGFSTRVEKNQRSLAGPALPDGEGRVTALAVAASYRACHQPDLEAAPKILWASTCWIPSPLAVFLNWTSSTSPPPDAQILTFTMPNMPPNSTAKRPILL